MVSSNKKDNDINELIKYLCFWESYKVKDLIFKYTKDINLNNINEYDVAITTKNNNTNILMALLKSVDFDGKKDLFDIITNHKNIKKIINSEDKDGNTLLHYATEATRYSLYSVDDNHNIAYNQNSNYYIDEIIRLGCTKNIENKNGITPLMMAVTNLDLNSVKSITQIIDSNPNKFDYNILRNALDSNIVIYFPNTKKIQYEMHSSIENRDLETRIKFNAHIDNLGQVNINDCININYDVEHFNKFSIINTICSKYKLNNYIMNNDMTDGMTPLEYSIKTNKLYMKPILFNGGKLTNNFDEKNLGLENITEDCKQFLLKNANKSELKKIESVLKIHKQNNNAIATNNKIK